ncbi:MAG: ATP-binding protein [Flavobacteriales bacterium]
MLRDAYQFLVQWKNRPDKKPLVIQGARQVGKTWLMKEFGRREYQHTAYFNFESTRELHSIFKLGYDIDRILAALNILSGTKIKAENTLIILDEIQSCPEAITSLKYFQENNPEYSIFAAGSLLGVAIHQGTSFPVGKVEFLTLYPLNFHEFMRAMGKIELLHELQKGDTVLIELFHDQFTELLKQYYFLGGMPEVVKEFAESKDYYQARLIQHNILTAYENDFSKHAPLSQLPRIRMVWQSIVGQLAKENSKFVYNVLRSGARAKDFELAIEWLKDAGLIHKAIRISKAGIPINAYADLSDFKIYLNDVGLLCAMGGLTPEIILKDNDLLIEFKGTVSEQFILQQLVNQNYTGYYWNPENAQSEVDFVIQKDNLIIPIEVKSATNVKSRSLRVYHDTYQPKICIRTSLAGYQKQNWMENIPLYGFLNWLSRRSGS